MPNEITEKNTKNQILAAYNEALEKLKESKREDRKLEKKKEDDARIVKTASENSVEKIINGIGQAKIEIMNSLDEVGEKLSSEFKKLEEILKAIAIETEYLNEIYEIKINADSLSALIQAQKEKKLSFELDIENKKTEFEEEITKKRLQWKLEQENYENQKSERDAHLKKDRQREEDEYNYNLQINRKKDIDAFAEQKASLEKELIEKRAAVEKELGEREKAVASREKEFEELKAKVEGFPQELENARKETEKSVLEKTEFKYKHQSELTQKEIEGERNLNKQLIVSLENKIKEQAEQIKQLTTKVNDAGQQVQTIAIKAIESAGGVSAQRMFAAGYEKHSEPQVKGKE